MGLKAGDRRASRDCAVAAPESLKPLRLSLTVAAEFYAAHDEDAGVGRVGVVQIITLPEFVEGPTCILRDAVLRIFVHAPSRKLSVVVHHILDLFS